MGFNVPTKNINFEVYDSLRMNLLGIAEVELPEFSAMTDEVAGAGIAGKIDLPSLGQFDSMTVKLNWRQTTAQALGLLAPVEHSLGIYAANQVHNPALGSVVPEQLRIELRGMTKTQGLGKLSGAKMDASTELEVLAISIFIDNVPVIVFDKLNFIYAVNGVDYLAAVRVAMGRV